MPPQIHTDWKLQDLTRSGIPRTGQERINAVRKLFTCTEPMKSLRNAETQLHISRATIRKIFKQLLYRYPYKIQTLQALTAQDKQRLLRFAQHALSQSCIVTEYPSKIMLSDGCTFDVKEYVKKQNVRIWAKNGPHR